jgi:AbrB family looped-hinge helix DNA binding protein
MSTATLTSKGQITIPKDVREALALEPGDRLSFELREDGIVELRAETLDLMSLFGTIKPKKRGVTLEQMKGDIAKAASKP